MKYREHHFCDWCMKGFWDNDLSKTFTWGHTIFCCKECRYNYQYSKGYIVK